MPGIICAVRGGPDSQPTIEKAISLALEVEMPLYFLYIVNLDFLSHTQVSRVSTISEEMAEMGEFILLSAQEKAKKHGVDAEGVIRNGKVREEIVNLAVENGADYVVLGLPQGQEEKDIFAADRIRDFGDLIEEQSGAKVILVPGKKQDE